MAETQEEPKEKQEETKGGGFSSLLSAEGLFMLTVALLVDIVELFIPLEPIDPVDIFAIALFGSWTFMRSGQMRLKKGSAAKVGKAAKLAKRMKWLRPVLYVGEMVPFVGAAPLWVVSVYLELKNS